MKASIFTGTSGWSYKHWKDKFYPEGLKQPAWLDYYTTQFRITELNASFYHLPKKQTTEMWAEKVPSDFMFCPKMSRYVTHLKRLKEPEEGFENFFDVFAPLAGKLGPVLIQLPPSLKFEADKTEHLYQLCKQQYSSFLFAIEVRHASWLTDASYTLMKKYDIAFVISQSSVGFPYAEKVTAKHIYVRFHGPEQLYASSYSDEQLMYYAELFKNWKKEGHSVWAFFNNDVGVYATANAKRLIELCG